jgi:hypothetical protein
MYEHHILNYFCLAWIHLIKFRFNLIIFLKNPTNIEKLECMEYICDKIVLVIESQNLHIYFKTKVVSHEHGKNRPYTLRDYLNATTIANQCYKCFSSPSHLIMWLLFHTSYSTINWVTSCHMMGRNMFVWVTSMPLVKRHVHEKLE